MAYRPGARALALSPQDKQRHAICIQDDDYTRDTRPRARASPCTPTRAPCEKTPKRRRAVSVEDSSPSKAPRGEDWAPIDVDTEGLEIFQQSKVDTADTVEIFNTSDNEKPLSPKSAEVDSEGFEIYRQPYLETPTTVEIFNTSDTEIPPIPDSPQQHVGTGLQEPRIDLATPTEPSPGSRTDTAPCPSSTSGYGARSDEEAELTGPESFAVCAQAPRAEGDCYKQIVMQEAIASRCLQAPTKASSSDQKVPEMTPKTFHHFLNLGKNSPDGSPTIDMNWKDPSVSYIPANHPLGPRDLPPGHYRCPFPSCHEPFGLDAQTEGYDEEGLRQHLLKGLDFHVDPVLCSVRLRVQALRRSQGKDEGPAPKPFHGRSPARAQRVMEELMSDLEELRAWERSRRVVVSRRGETVSVRPATADDELSVAQRKDKDEQSKATDSSNSCLRANRFLRLRDKRFARPKKGSVVHVKEVVRSPPENQAREALRNRGSNSVKMPMQTSKGQQEESNTEDSEAGETFAGMDVD